MLNVDFSSSKLNKIFIRIVSSSLLATISLIGGVAPEISRSYENGNGWRSPSISFSNRAFAQQFTPEETTNYAKAGYQIELLRRQVYKEIKTKINQPPPNIVCDQEETLANLNLTIRQIADRYCSQSQQIVRQNNLSTNRFNELKTYYDRQEDFYQQVQNVLLKLQN